MGHELVSLAHVTPTPWDTPREMTEERLEKEIDKLMQKVKNPRQAIFNFHVPLFPAGTFRAERQNGEAKVARLLQEIEAEPKTLKWRMRARVGDKKK